MAGGPASFPWRQTAGGSERALPVGPSRGRGANSSRVPREPRADSEPGPFPRQRRLSCERREAAGREWQKKLQAEVEKNQQVQKGNF
ncbi:uncharacterized protein LOC134296848 isoform X2 [Anolis carolinensis]|uniref:uncharacterized protein LOC134296848 isoform X2 n=1 Tax=Anolis carolinensis TaxID=28377 RepID=UPI002F2B7035